MSVLIEKHIFTSILQGKFMFQRGSVLASWFCVSLGICIVSVRISIGGGGGRAGEGEEGEEVKKLLL